MSTVVLLAATGLGLGALYFLIASGLSLIFGLMDVLNFAHGALLSIGAYATWWATSGHVPGAGAHGFGFLLAVCFGTAVGTLAAVVLELTLIRPLYSRPREQVLSTVGVGLAVPALLSAIWGPDARPFPGPSALSGTDKRTTIEFACCLLLTRTYWPAFDSLTALRCDDSAATSFEPLVFRLGPSSAPFVSESSASYSR